MLPAGSNTLYDNHCITVLHLSAPFCDANGPFPDKTFPALWGQFKRRLREHMDSNPAWKPSKGLATRISELRRVGRGPLAFIDPRLPNKNLEVAPKLQPPFLLRYSPALFANEAPEMFNYDAETNRLTWASWTVSFIFHFDTQGAEPVRFSSVYPSAAVIQPTWLSTSILLIACRLQRTWYDSANASVLGTVNQTLLFLARGVWCNWSGTSWILTTFTLMHNTSHRRLLTYSWCRLSLRPGITEPWLNSSQKSSGKSADCTWLYCTACKERLHPSSNQKRHYFVTFRDKQSQQYLKPVKRKERPNQQNKQKCKEESASDDEDLVPDICSQVYLYLFKVQSTCTFCEVLALRNILAKHEGMFAHNIFFAQSRQHFACE